MKNLIYIFLLLGLFIWFLIKPATPIYTQVTGNVVDYYSNLPITDAKVKVLRLFNDGGLWVLLRYGYLEKTNSVITNPSGQFFLDKIIKDAKMTKGLWTGVIKVSKEGYIPFDQEIYDNLPTTLFIKLHKKNIDQNLPQGRINISEYLSKHNGNIVYAYINFEKKGLVNSLDSADVILRYDEAKNFNDLPKSSQYLGEYGGRYLSEIRGRIAIVKERQDNIFSSYEEVDHCNDQNYNYDIVNPGPSVFCAMTKEGKFAKILLWSVDYLDWTYQPNGKDDLRSDINKDLRI